jgi:hypothetical protein
MALLIALVGASLSAPLAAARTTGPEATRAATDVGRAAPKVALIVGPVGGTTARYRALAQQAARVARRYTPNVVEVYSPDATWPAVANALDGASIVVYLGHGNGWPSRYRDALYPVTQNGFGLNPVAGVDDATHQYFGEASLDQVHLAPNAIVLLHHLCYASGNTEPGLAEGTLDQAVQRVDNYAAGFIRAGARAVVAEGHFDPAWYVQQVLTSNRSIEQIWRSAPSDNGHEQEFESVRSPGFTARLDPDRAASGFFRSLVTAGQLDARAIRGGGSGVPVDVTIPATPTLAALGIQFQTPTFTRLPVAGIQADLSLPVADGRARDLPRDIKVGVRWDPLEVAGLPAAGPDTEGTAATTDSQPETIAPDAGPPEVSLVVAERPGAVVEATSARYTKTRIAIRVTFPSAPGRYRLVPTLHLPDGVAYDAATQALLTPVLVRVGGPFSAAYGVAQELTTATGDRVHLAVRIANTGLLGWAADIEVGDRAVIDEVDRPALRRLPARLIATWVSTDGAIVPAPVTAIVPEAASRPGGQGIARLDVVAPKDVGSYLLIIDIATPLAGPLSAAGSAPAIVRVTVTDPPPAVPTIPLEGGA